MFHHVVLIEAEQYHDGQSIPTPMSGEGILLRPGGMARLSVIDIGSARWLSDYTYPRFEDWNVRADDREGLPPDPQAVNMALYINGEVKVVPVVITYIDNPQYDPHRARDSAERMRGIYGHY